MFGTPRNFKKLKKVTGQKCYAIRSSKSDVIDRISGFPR